MDDLFDNKILCNKCNKVMQKGFLIKDGYKIRVLQCPECKKRILHPQDLAEYDKFKELRNKNFSVKLRIVGNSYAVSIPKEIVDFIQEQEKIHNHMVKLCFEKAGKLSLIFNNMMREINSEQKFIKENNNLDKK
ncbi:hypothetical protein CO154_02385 [Candidatus Pacearchaeota archaeon CG_4_9_14_3_um_filter_31_7]|nr:MAG: hypothetical protein COU55_02385 [Candidatus Pacearchaeota archaeon CG10_big_fil_rev_8_21_14_0_10_31_59]PIZ80035.1 MAG: hypothetical protein COX99_03150 [Candidatus Pacearchaeota archaeon CG_4_10_14_0_2_um_filter_31_10]PJA70532.1 MAG: hypothetical protein CO154_02385 [Candidatus Pacearchaeota archaeon CG_4_9_14_3_um_filter_31_7]